MLNHRKTWLTVFLLGLGCLLSSGTSSRAEEKKGVLFSKKAELTADDEKDTKLKRSTRKVYTVKLTEGQAYRIDLNSTDFDTFLRLENAAGKEVAFNDDIAPNDLNSRLIYVAPKTADYRLIVTSYDGKTGSFNLEMKLASDVEAKEARFMSRIERFGESSRKEQKQLIAEVTKGLLEKGEKLTLKDAQMAAGLSMQLDEDDAAFAKETLESFKKIFAGESDKNLAGQMANFVDSLAKQLNKIGKEFEITGKTLDGKDFDLKNLKGKVVLIDFWGTWCPPCVAEIPNIVKAYEKYHGKGFEVIGVASDKSDEVVTEFIKEPAKLPWACINIEDSRKMIKKHEVTSYPSPILVGPDGRVVSTRARGPQLDRLLERLITDKK